MAIRDFSGGGGAQTMAALAQTNLLDPTKQVDLFKRGMTGIQQVEPQRQLRDLMAGTTQENYADNLAKLNLLAAQSSPAYQEQAKSLLSGFGDARTATESERRNLEDERLRSVDQAIRRRGQTINQETASAGRENMRELERMRQKHAIKLFGLENEAEKKKPSPVETALLKETGAQLSKKLVDDPESIVRNVVKNMEDKNLVEDIVLDSPTKHKIGEYLRNYLSTQKNEQKLMKFLQMTDSERIQEAARASGYEFKESPAYVRHLAPSNIFGIPTGGTDWYFEAIDPKTQKQ